MKDNGVMINKMGLDIRSIIREMFIMENGRLVKNMDLENILVIMVISIVENGRMGICMVKVSLNTLMEMFMMVIGLKVEGMVRVG